MHGRTLGQNESISVTKMSGKGRISGHTESIFVTKHSDQDLAMTVKQLSVQLLKLSKFDEQERITNLNITNTKFLNKHALHKHI